MRKLLFISLLSISSLSLFSIEIDYIDLNNKALGSRLDSHLVLKNVYEKIIRKKAFEGINLRGNRLDLLDDEDWNDLLKIIETLRDFGNGIWIGLEFTNLKYVSPEYRKRLGHSIKKTGCKQVYPCVAGNGLVEPYYECEAVLDIVNELNKNSYRPHPPTIFSDIRPELRFPAPKRVFPARNQ